MFGLRPDPDLYPLTPASSQKSRCRFCRHSQTPPQRGTREGLRAGDVPHSGAVSPGEQHFCGILRLAPPGGLSKVDE